MIKILLKYLIVTTVVFFFSIDVAICNFLLMGASAAASGVGFGVSGGENTATVGDVDSTIATGHFFISGNAALTVNRVYTLPPCATFGNHILDYRDDAGGIGAFTATLLRAGSDTIDGGTLVIIAKQYGGTQIRCDGTSKWTQIGSIPSFSAPSGQFVTGISASGVWSSGAPTLVIPITYVPGINPNNIPIFRANVSRTVTAIVCRPEVAAGGTATISVYKAPSGSAISGGGATILHSGSFDANGTAATDQSLTITTSSLSSGDTVGIRTTGTTVWTSAGVATGICTVHIQ